MANDEFVNFEKALNELQLSEEQLKRLVSEGEIRAIRGDNNTMRFRREEIDRLKQDTGKTLQYTEESSETLTDDLLFDEADDLDIEDEGMTTAQISSEDTLVGPDSSFKKPSAQPTATPAPSRGARSTGAQQRGSTTTVRRTTGRSTKIRQASAAQAATGIGMGIAAMLIVTFIIGAFTLFIWRDTAKNQVSSITRGIVDFAGESAGVQPKTK